MKKNVKKDVYCINNIIKNLYLYILFYNKLKFKFYNIISLIFRFQNIYTF